MRVFSGINRETTCNQLCVDTVKKRVPEAGVYPKLKKGCGFTFQPSQAQAALPNLTEVKGIDTRRKSFSEKNPELNVETYPHQLRIFYVKPGLPQA